MWYAIQSSDDWLSKLAAKYLGNVMDYTVIYEMNKDVLTSGPDVVRAGMRIWIPVDGKPKPMSNTATSTPSTSIPSAGKPPMDKNKILMAAGGVMGLIALLTLMRKK